MGAYSGKSCDLRNFAISPGNETDNDTSRDRIKDRKTGVMVLMTRKDTKESVALFFFVRFYPN